MSPAGAAFFFRRTIYIFLILRTVVTTYVNKNEISFAYGILVRNCIFNRIVTKIGYQICLTSIFSGFEVQYRRNSEFHEIESNFVVIYAVSYNLRKQKRNQFCLRNSGTAGSYDLCKQKQNCLCKLV